MPKDNKRNDPDGSPESDAGTAAGVDEPAAVPAHLATRKPTLVFIQSNGDRRAIEATVGMTVMQAAVGNCVPGIPAECGGHLACGTCHVYVAAQNRAVFPAPSQLEVEMLGFTAAETKENSRLSCQLVVTVALDEAEFLVPDRQI
jgi:2Fe-2S ferredoxin